MPRPPTPRDGWLTAVRPADPPVAANGRLMIRGRERRSAILDRRFAGAPISGSPASTHLAASFWRLRTGCRRIDAAHPPYAGCATRRRAIGAPGKGRKRRQPVGSSPTMGPRDARRVEPANGSRGRLIGTGPGALVARGETFGPSHGKTFEPTARPVVSCGFRAGLELRRKQRSLSCRPRRTEI